MRVPIIAAIILGLLSLLADVYIYRAIVKRIRSRVIKWVHVAISLACYLMVGSALLLPYRTGADTVLITVTWMLFTFVSVYFAKYLFIIFDLIASVPRMVKKPRIKWLSRTGAVLACVLFVLMWWGALVNRFNIDVNEVDVEIKDLPAAFEGYKVVQISDMHLGSYHGDTTFVKKIVNKVNSLKPDVVFFTGDIVNRKSDEMLPYVSTLSEIKAPVYAILGNHDYGDYTVWPSDEAKMQNMEVLYEAYKRTGWTLLRNESVVLHRGNDSIAVIGVENIGDPPFHIYGDLKKSYANTSDGVTKILLSHNPAHWVSAIADHDEENIALTLAGHTHAMQVELLGLSPAAFRYSTWGGMYDDASGKHQLYVNIGIGTVGIPARIGATPEITLLHLQRER